MYLQLSLPDILRLALTSLESAAVEYGSSPVPATPQFHPEAAPPEFIREQMAYDT